MKKITTFLIALGTHSVLLASTPALSSLHMIVEANNDSTFINHDVKYSSEDKKFEIATKFTHKIETIKGQMGKVVLTGYLKLPKGVSSDTILLKNTFETGCFDDYYRYCKTIEVAGKPLEYEHPLVLKDISKIAEKIPFKVILTARPKQQLQALDTFEILVANQPLNTKEDVEYYPATFCVARD